MEEKIWYAVVLDDEDTYWGNGSVDRARAEDMVKYFKRCGWTNTHIVRFDISGVKPVRLAD